MYCGMITTVDLVNVCPCTVNFFFNENSVSNFQMRDTVLSTIVMILQDCKQDTEDSDEFYSVLIFKVFTA